MKCRGVVSVVKKSQTVWGENKSGLVFGSFFFIRRQPAVLRTAVECKEWVRGHWKNSMKHSRTTEKLLVGVSTICLPKWSRTTGRSLKPVPTQRMEGAKKRIFGVFEAFFWLICAAKTPQIGHFVRFCGVFKAAQKWPQKVPQRQRKGCRKRCCKKVAKNCRRI